MFIGVSWCIQYRYECDTYTFYRCVIDFKAPLQIDLLGTGKRYFGLEERSEDVMADKVVTGCWACGKWGSPRWKA